MKQLCTLEIFLTVLLILIVKLYLAKGNFVLTVKFINYTNPTGLCAECSGGLEGVTSADQLTPVCCDESPFRSNNCNNTGEARCDTRFRWTLRQFGAPLETRPVSVPGATTPPYYFTNCDLSPTTCPFSEMNTTFSQGPTGFLGVAANPLTVVPIPKTNFIFTSWPEQVQFFIEAIDSGLPNIIDSLLINLDNLQVRADFTEEMTFTGYHNISHMTMSFRVACQTGFCGRDCTVTRLITNVINPRIFSCHTNGTIVCTDSRYNPSASCNECLHNLNISTDCSTCLESNFDPDTDCTACLQGHDIGTNCSTCLNSNYELSTNCTTCLLGPSYNPVTDCTSCLLDGHDPLTNCTQCLPNRDPSTDCSTCLFGFDISRDCSDCLPGRNISTNCTTCLSGYAGESCVQETTLGSILSVPLILGIAGGVGGALLLLTIVVVTLMCLIRSRGHVEPQPDEATQMTQNPVYDVATVPFQKSTNAVHTSGNSTEEDHYIETEIETTENQAYGISTAVSSTADTDAIHLQPNVLYIVSTEPDRGDQNNYYESVGLEPLANTQEEYDYVQV